MSFCHQLLIIGTAYNLLGSLLQRSAGGLRPRSAEGSALPLHPSGLHFVNLGFYAYGEALISMLWGPLSQAPSGRRVEYRSLRKEPLRGGGSKLERVLEFLPPL